MKVNLHTPVEEVQIQLIPLIDVIFCILTFFLLAALQFTRQQAINIDLPKANSGTSPTGALQANSNILPVTIDAVGQTYVEKNMVTREQLAEVLKRYVQANPNGVLVLNASRTATYNDVIETLDLLRQVGGDRVSLGIIPGPSPTSTNPNAPVIPSFPINPGTTEPNSAPLPGVTPQGGNPNFPLTPTQPQPGTGINPVNPQIAPVVPNSTQPNQNVAPGTTNSAPKRR
ncbi:MULTISPECIES: ExbD/TolR family protein [Calothrix]|uniref:Biopolymer transporter ExbD n=2 Tax=Calothrix TaxID=1186 RepID=A0ABR8A8P1_9CYAN|nr:MULTISPECIES: biopolymer transporter ExbD [Calothrix]MBD2196199.1 biopolymer transporter ExbD [Calothrix parietina FACHB-288]MBD2224852.1 biopolymer transporter ExbD [Calothrix anomala FACHB-343]